MGISQLIRTLVIKVLPFSLGQTDIAGIIYFLINLPLIYLAWSKMGRIFFARSIITIIIQTAALTFIPIPSSPVIDDYLTACVIGGIIAGTGSGEAVPEADRTFWASTFQKNSLDSASARSPSSSTVSSTEYAF